MNQIRLVGWRTAFATVTVLLLLLCVARHAAAQTPVETPSQGPASAAAPASAPAPAPSPEPDPAGLTGGPTAPLVTGNPWLAGQPDSFFAPDGTFKPYKGDAPTATEAYHLAMNTTYHLNFAWTLVGGFLVMFMMAGFALVETGLTRAKNAAHTMSMNIFVYALGVAAFFVCGYALMCGGANHSGVGGPGGLGGVPTLNAGYTVGQPVGGDSGWLLFGTKGFFLSGGAYDGAAIVWFLFMMVFMDTTITIPTGALAERWSFKSFCVFSTIVAAVVYPIYAGWVWGGGWLAQMGYRMGLGHGAVDFAGSGVVHLQGGTMALVCAAILGPRIGKYDENGKPRPILGHNIPMVVIGTVILAFGWFGFNSGSTMAGSDGRIGVVATNTMLASASGAIAACLTVWMTVGKPDPTMICNGMLAGLVAITAPCAFVAPWAAFVTGIVAGVIVVFSVFFWERIHIDDPVGAISVHGVCGAWGLLALGLFADGTYGAGFNNVGLDKYMGVAGKGVTGLLYGDGKQFLAECIDVAVCVAWNLVVAGGVYWVIGKVIGNRVPAAVEIAGLDIPEMGAPAYPEYLTPIAPEQVPAEQIANATRTVPGKLVGA